jgi:hypothetical protein
MLQDNVVRVLNKLLHSARLDHASHATSRYNELTLMLTCYVVHVLIKLLTFGTFGSCFPCDVVVQ